MELPVVDAKLAEAKKACVRLETLKGTAVPAPAGKLALPMSMKEAKARGWDELDVVFVTGSSLSPATVTSTTQVSRWPF